MPAELEAKGANYYRYLQELEETPGAYNGLSWVALAADGDEIVVCETDYATRRTLTPEGPGRPLTVGCLVFSEGDHLLWARRGSWVAVEPGLWEPGCAGALESLGEAYGDISRELNEELGLQADPSFRGVCQRQDEIMLLFTARVLRDEPQPMMPEVEEVRWLSLGEEMQPCSTFSSALAGLAEELL